MPRTVTDEDIRRHEGLIRHFARQLALNSDMIEDLEQEGRLAAFEALQGYDSSRASEATHVWHRVRGAMLHYLRDKAHMIRYPGWLNDQGVYPGVVRSLETMQQGRHLERAGQLESAEHAPSPQVLGGGPADPNVDVEASALAREELGRATRRAHLSPRQEQALTFHVLGGECPKGSTEAVRQAEHKAREKLWRARKLRQAVAA